MEYIKLADAEKIEGLPPRATLRRWIQNGEVKGRIQKKGSRKVYELLASEVARLLEGEEQTDWEPFRLEWVTWQLNGMLTGKPMGQRSVQVNQYGLQKFWEHLGRPESLRDITADNLRKALAAVPLDRDKQNCHFTIRDNMFKAVRSFLKFAIAKGLRSETDLLATRPLKPKRVYPARKTIAYDGDLDKLLLANENLSGRTRFDRDYARILIFLASHAGLRASEIINLKVADVSLRLGIIFVRLGKGYKEREVGITPALAKEIEAWLKRRPGEEDWFLVQANGKKSEYRAMCRRIERLGDQADIDITLHGLRRSFATLMTSQGMPLPFIQDQLGHEEITTTEGYILTNRRQAIEWLKNFKSETKQKTREESPEPKKSSRLSLSEKMRK